MSDIYSGAIVNIAASTSVNSEGGLWRQRNPLSVIPCIVPVRNAKVSGKPHICVFWPVAWGLKQLNDTALNQRAWVLQERLLAPRTIHCTSSKIYWECREIIVSERDPHHKFMTYEGMGNTSRWALPAGADQGDEKHSEACLFKWHQAFILFIHRKLTRSSDRLVAMAGTAKYISSLWRDSNINYLAGLWSVDLTHSLLWRRASPPGTATRADTYRAPSWSWASINGAVTFDVYFDWARLSSVIDAKTCSNSDHFVAVHGGYIRIKGPLCTAILVWDDSQTPVELHLSAGDKDIVVTDLFLDDDDPRSILAYCPDRVYLLGMLTNPSYQQPSPTKGLVLIPTRNQRGQYHRIGSYFFVAPLSLAADVETVDAHSEDFDANIAAFYCSIDFTPHESLYLEHHGNHTYTIEII